MIQANINWPNGAHNIPTQYKLKKGDNPCSISVSNLGKPLAEQAEIGHNRWHPDIPELTSVKPREEIILECLDFLDAQIKDNDSANDVRDVDLTRAHPLTGPVHVEGAEPGDILVVDLLDIN